MDEAHIRGVAVRPQWQGHGVAEQLLSAAESRARSMGCARTTVDTTEPLQRAMHFYEQDGYRRTGIVRHFFSMPLPEYGKAVAAAHPPLRGTFSPPGGEKVDVA